MHIRYCRAAAAPLVLNHHLDAKRTAVAMLVPTNGFQVHWDQMEALDFAWAEVSSRTSSSSCAREAARGAR